MNQNEQKFPKRFVVRKLMKKGEVVAYFPSPALLFKECKIYNCDGKCKEKYEIDFITQIHNKSEYEVENSPALDRYYKNEIFLDYKSCKEYVYFLNAKLWLNASKNLDKTEKENLMNGFKKHFKVAEGLGKELRIEIGCKNINER